MGEHMPTKLKALSSNTAVLPKGERGMEGTSVIVTKNFRNIDAMA